MINRACECRSCDVVLLGKGLTNWTGGIDYLRLCIEGLSATLPALRIGVSLPQPPVRARIRTLLGDAKRGILQVFHHGTFDIARIPAPTLEEVRNALTIDRIACDVVPYRDSRKGLLSVVRTLGAHAVFPSLESLGPEFPVPWVGYIPDFQHQYLPELFSRRERRSRDVIFGNLIRDARVLSLNSRAVADDIRRFYPSATCRLVVLPFAPAPAAGWLEFDFRETLRRYRLPPRYFLISNQFWVHKSHITAFEALLLLHAKSEFRDVELICTGSTYDYRWPRYFEELGRKVKALGLSSKIRFLGKIPKIEQIAIMRRAVAVLQPTLSEGGPGGGSVYDAVAVGTPVIASDIPVNREIEHESVRFFPARSAEKLVQEMEYSLATPYQRPQDSILREQGRIALEKVGAKIIEAIAFAK